MPVVAIAKQIDPPASEDRIVSRIVLNRYVLPHPPLALMKYCFESLFCTVCIISLKMILCSCVSLLALASALALNSGISKSSSSLISAGSVLVRCLT